jgi:thiol:disulfide interchange protein
MLRCILLLAAIASATTARAIESAPSTTPRATVTLVSEMEAVAPGRSFRVLLRQRLAPGWHTYWINPGDAGQPPEVDFVLPPGASATPLRFPAPHRIPFGPLVNFGYEGEALFTATVTVPADARPGASLPVEARASWLVCERVCIPEEATFRIDLPVAASPQPSAAARPLFVAAEAAEPRAAPWSARFSQDGRAASIELAGDGLGPAAIREAFFFPLTEGLIDNAATQTLEAQDGALRLALVRGNAAVPAVVEGVVAIVDGAGVHSAYRVSTGASPVAATTAGPAPAAPVGLLTVIGWAFLGGLILNLMPCVFPILAMKAVGIAGLSGRERGAVRAHAASYVAGVVLSFVALAAVLLVLRQAGLAAGWGFQFTSPLFVAATAWVMLAVGLSLSGVMHVGGPVGIGQSLAVRGGHAGSFATGVLAVVVATPCTAPFMAAAIAAAVAMPAPAMLGVFAAMGLGMAAPYGLLALVPSLARLLPRPGAWMDVFKQALAFPMYGAAAWLVWVLAQQSGADGVLVALVGGVLIAFAAWSYGAVQRSGADGLRLGHGFAAVALIGAVALLPQLRTSAAGPAAATTAAHAERWSAERVAALRAEGRPVFVNLTAAWCITCKVNERVALRADAVQRAFAARNVAQLEGDWTSGDAEITRILREHGREGVPLYLYYAGDAPPAVLPQILTEGIVLQAIGADQSS